MRPVRASGFRLGVRRVFVTRLGGGRRIARRKRFFQALFELFVGRFRLFGVLVFHLLVHRELRVAIDGRSTKGTGLRSYPASTRAGGNETSTSVPWSTLLRID